MAMIIPCGRSKSKRGAPVTIDGYLTHEQQIAVDFYAAARKREKLEKINHIRNLNSGERPGVRISWVISTKE